MDCLKENCPKCAICDLNTASVGNQLFRTGPDGWMPDQTAGGYEQLFHKALIFITTSNAPAAFSFRSIFQMLNLVKQEGVFFSSSSLFSYILSKSDKSLFDPLLLSLALSLSFFFSFFPLPPLFFSLELTLNNIRSAAHKEGRKGRRKDRRRSRRMMKPPEELGKKKEKKKGSEKVRGERRGRRKSSPSQSSHHFFLSLFFYNFAIMFDFCLS